MKKIAVFTSHVYEQMSGQMQKGLIDAARKYGVKLIFFASFGDSYSSRNYGKFSRYDEGDCVSFDIPDLLEEIYQNNQPLMKAKPDYLGLNKLDDSAVVLRFTVDVAEGDIFAGARALNHDLFIGMRKLGIEVPFPQLDLHQK